MERQISSYVEGQVKHGVHPDAARAGLFQAIRGFEVLHPPKEL